MQAKVFLQGKNSDEIYEVLSRNLNQSKAKVRKINYGAECVFDEFNDVKQGLSKTVREYVVNFVEPGEIKKIVNRCYDFFDSYEKKLLAGEVKKAIDGETDIQEQLFVMRRNRIIEKVSENYLREHSTLNIEGFVPFRLQSYRDELETLVEYNAEAYMVKREYTEFIFLLKSYLETQPVFLNAIEVFVTENRQYIFFSSSGKDITKKLEREMFSDSEPGQDDMLVNVLITKNPGKIVIHNRRFMKKEIADTLKLIFENRCIFCEGCNLCKKNHSIKT